MITNWRNQAYRCEVIAKITSAIAKHIFEASPPDESAELEIIRQLKAKFAVTINRDEQYRILRFYHFHGQRTEFGTSLVPVSISRHPS